MNILPKRRSGSKQSSSMQQQLKSPKSKNAKSECNKRRVKRKAIGGGAIGGGAIGGGAIGGGAIGGGAMVGKGTTACAFAPNLPSNHPRQVKRSADLISKVIKEETGTEEINDVEAMGLERVDKNREYLLYPHAKGDFADFDDKNENNFATCRAVQLPTNVPKEKQLAALNEQYVNLIQDNGGKNLFVFLEELALLDLNNYKQVLKRFVSVLKGVLLLNVNGICHRDIKMPNITVDPRMRIIDFGLATNERLLSSYTHASFADTKYVYWPVDYRLAVCFASDAFHHGTLSKTEVESSVLIWHKSSNDSDSKPLETKLMSFLRSQGVASDEIRFMIQSCKRRRRWPTRKKRASSRNYLHALRLEIKLNEMPQYAKLLHGLGVETSVLRSLLDAHVEHAATSLDNDLWTATNKSSFQDSAVNQLGDFVLTCQSKLGPAVVDAKARAAFLKKLEKETFSKLDVFSAGMVMLEMASMWQDEIGSSGSSSSSSDHKLKTDKNKGQQKDNKKDRQQPSKNADSEIASVLQSIAQLASQMVNANPFKRLNIKQAIDRYLDALLKLRIVTKAEHLAHKADVACICKIKTSADAQCKTSRRHRMSSASSPPRRVRPPPLKR
jgi:serine/threonine protein kinase